MQPWDQPESQESHTFFEDQTHDNNYVEDQTNDAPGWQTMESSYDRPIAVQPPVSLIYASNISHQHHIAETVASVLQELDIIKS